MADLALDYGDQVTIRSAHGEVEAIVEQDTDLPRGCVSMMFAYGGEGDVRVAGTNPNALISCNAIFDRYTGQPRMSNLPIAIHTHGK